MKQTKGFTLVELVITIAIVIILSMVSIPIYKSYTYKAKMSEGYALLGVIFSAQKAYFSEYGRFLHSKQSSGGNNRWTCNETVLGIDARGNKYFSYFNVNSEGTLENLHAWVLKPADLADGANNKCLLLRYYPGNKNPLEYIDNHVYDFGD